MAAFSDTAFSRLAFSDAAFDFDSIVIDNTGDSPGPGGAGDDGTRRKRKQPRIPHPRVPSASHDPYYELRIPAIYRPEEEDVEPARTVADRDAITKAQLIEMGFDEEEALTIIFLAAII